jgi:hypothetical protein
MIPPAAAASSFLSALPGFMATKTTSTLARDKLPYHAPSCGPLSGRSGNHRSDETNAASSARIGYLYRDKTMV